MAKTAILSIRIVSNAADAERGIDRTSRNLRKLDRDSGAAGAKLSRMYQQLDRVADAAFRVGAASTGLQAITVAAVSAGKALAPLAGLLAAVPGALAAGGAAFATFKVATSGFGDAVKAAGKDAKKFNETTKGMPKSMVSAVRATKQLGDAFGTVQRQVQAAYWQGIDKEIRRLGTDTFPTLRRAMTRVAKAGNGFTVELLRAARTKPAMDALVDVFELARRVIDSLSPAVGPLASGLAKIAGASARMIPGFKGAEDAAKRFNSWATKITKNGDLARWFRDAKTAAGQLGDLFGGVGRALGGIAKAADAAGSDAGLGSFAKSVNRIADAINRPEIQSKLTESFKKASDVANAATDVLIKLLPFVTEYGTELLLLGAAWKFAAAMVGLYRGAVHLATGAQAIFNFVVGLNPLVLLIAAIVAVAAALWWLYNNVEGFRDAVNKVIGEIVKFWFNAWVRMRSITTISVGAMSLTVAGLKTAAERVATAVATALANGIRNARLVWTASTTVMRAALGLLSNSGSVVAGAVRRALTSAASGIAGAFIRAASLARVALFTIVGAASATARAVSGALGGIMSKARTAASVVSGVVGSMFGSGTLHQKVTVQSTLPEPGEPFYLHAAGLVTSPTRWFNQPRQVETSIVNVTVTGAIDPNETARQIRRILDRDARRDGAARIGAGAWA